MNPTSPPNNLLFARRLLYILAAILVATFIVAVVVRHAGSKNEDANREVTPSKHTDVATVDREASTQSMLAWLAPDEVAGQGILPQARIADGGSTANDGDTDVVFQPLSTTPKPIALIHIGLPMAADTAFQVKMVEYRSALQSVGWDLILPAVGSSPESKVKAGNCLYADIVEKPVPAAFCDSSVCYVKDWTSLAKKTYSNTNLILSAEGFADLARNNNNDSGHLLRKLHSMFSSSHDVHILLVFREKKALAASFYKYMYSRRPELSMSHHRIMHYPPPWMYVNQTLKGWGKVFGNGRVHVFSFEHLFREQLDLFQVVGSHIAGLDLTSYERMPRPTTSRSILETSVGFMIMDLALNRWGLSREDVQSCVDIGRVLDQLGGLNTIAQNCMTQDHEDFWQDWTRTELDSAFAEGLFDLFGSPYDMRNIPRELYAPYFQREGPEWCEVDRSAYSDDQIEEAIRLASGDCWEKLMLGM